MLTEHFGQMDSIKVKVLSVAFSVVIMLFPSNVECQLRAIGGGAQPQPQRPLCVSQLSLVNYACAVLIPSMVPVPTPPTPGAAMIFPEHAGHHHHHHHHHHDGGNQGLHQSANPAEANCCKWLNNVDSECVCDLLVHLPAFLAKPIHEYTIIVGEACRVSYACGGRAIP